MLLGDATWADVSAGGVLLVPVGATEQHGPHLPLSTDTDLAVALCVALAERDATVTVAPPLAVAASGEHQAFPGTLSIGREALTLVVVELCRSATATFGRVVLVNAHGGNLEALRHAERTLRAEGRDVTAWSPRWGTDAHAGRSETSLMLALHPTRVRLDRAAPGNPAPLGELLPRLREAGVRAVSANGVLGDPTGASAEEGRALLTAALDALEAVVRVSAPR